ncbi:MAG: hypothetical protein ING82_13370 [Roseomonas sp.]|nr:hypothetical protein [Roseomonas sp.]
MSGEVLKLDDPKGAIGGEERTNERSSIAFPYVDLNSVVEVAKALHARAGRGACELDGLAAELKQVVGGAFRLRTAAAKVFGLMEKEGRNAARLTPLGLRIISPDEEIAARADAFLAVPLYQKIFERYRGGLLPPPKALEREMMVFGVAPKVADRARQAFERSADQAGFFEAGDNRLVRPRIDAEPNGSRSLPETGRSEDLRKEEKIPVNEGVRSDENLHPFIQGLLKTLPATGSQWPIKDRAKWLKLAANAFDLIYEGEGEIEIKAATDAA